MQTLTAWAARHAVSPAALQDLIYTLGLAAPGPVPPPPGMQTEAAIQVRAQIEHARRTGGRMFRNNSGAFKDETGRLVRYGLGNTSAQINKVIKSSDLIGITPTTCPCGHIYGVFTAMEAKAPGWKFRESDERAVAQFAFGKLVVSLGGIFKFITRLEDI